MVFSKRLSLLILFYFVLGSEGNLHSYALTLTELPLKTGFLPIPFYREDAAPQLSQENKNHNIKQLCQKLRDKYHHLGWKEDPCSDISWRYEYSSRSAHPLIYTVFGHGDNKTLILGGVHPDELTPVHLSFRMAKYFKDNPKSYDPAKHSVIIAPLVNPDGLFFQKPTRTNGLVDPNRNFLTLDWYEKALPFWSEKQKNRERYFPGFFPDTEPETVFQRTLIDHYMPDKILSIHAPLGFLNYDGPGDSRHKPYIDLVKEAKKFVHAIAKESANYKVVDYSLFPGSLGNFAGKERNIRTVTVELKTENPKHAEDYFNTFLQGFILSVNYPRLAQR